MTLLIHITQPPCCSLGLPEPSPQPNTKPLWQISRYFVIFCLHNDIILIITCYQAQKEAAGSDAGAIAKIDAQLERVQAGQWMCEVFDKVAELSRRLTEWSCGSGIQLAQGRRISGVTRYHGKSQEDIQEDQGGGSGQTFVIATGGGPGFMEAANMGAAMVPGAKNIGVSVCV